MSSLNKFYFKNSQVNKPIEEIWRDIDSHTLEITNENDKSIREQNQSNVLLPPLYCKGKLLKGLLAGPGIDYLISIRPEIEKYFITIANSMWGSYPQSEKADAYYTLYKNPQRENWFKTNSPEKKDKILLPYQDADYVNEYMFYPIEFEKDIDIFMVARLHECKNIDIFLESLIYVEKQYGKNLNVTILIGSSSNQEQEDEILEKLYEIAGSKEKLSKYITFIKKVPQCNMASLYSRSKLTAITSIFEGKNRAIQESLLCNTPVICFSCFNQYIRGESSILPDNCAYYVEEFSSEAFGEKLYELFKNDKFLTNTREIALKHYGRKLLTEKVIKSIPYYQENIPNLNDGEFISNDYINKALSENLHCSYFQFLYEKTPLGLYPTSENNLYQFYMMMKKSTANFSV